jgi:hypothetical protein
VDSSRLLFSFVAADLQCEPHLQSDWSLSVWQLSFAVLMLKLNNQLLSPSTNICKVSSLPSFPSLPSLSSFSFGSVGDWEIQRRVVRFVEPKAARGEEEEATGETEETVDVFIGKLNLQRENGTANLVGLLSLPTML